MISSAGREPPTPIRFWPIQQYDTFALVVYKFHWTLYDKVDINVGKLETTARRATKNAQTGAEITAAGRAKNVKLVYQAEDWSNGRPPAVYKYTSM